VARGAADAAYRLHVVGEEAGWPVTARATAWSLPRRRESAGIGAAQDGGTGGVTFYVEVDDPAAYLKKVEELGPALIPGYSGPTGSAVSCSRIS
jgi:hypothetical protein